MAEQHGRGWIWVEGDAAPPGILELHRRSDGVATQIGRFAESVPLFANEARKIGERFTSACEPLGALWRARKNKYRPISPEQAKESVEAARHAEQDWLAFLARPDVQVAIGRANRDIKARRRVHRRQLQDHRETVLRALDEDPKLRAAVEVRVHDALDKAVECTEAMSEGFFGPEDRSIVRRLILVEFLRMTAAGSAPRAAMLREIVYRSPRPTMRDVATAAGINLVRDGLASLASGKPVFFDSSTVIEERAAIALRQLLHWVSAWRRDGLPVGGIGRRYFMVEGLDCSLEVYPE